MKARVELEHVICTGKFTGVSALFYFGEDGIVSIFFPAVVVKEAEELGCKDWLGKTSQRKSISSDVDVLLSCKSAGIFKTLISNLELINSEDVPDEVVVKRMISFVSQVQILNEEREHIESLERAAEEFLSISNKQHK